VTFAPEVRVIAHDASTLNAVGHARIARVRIGSRVFVGARTIILPGVTIGDDVVIGAGSVVSRDIPSGVVAAGNPARVHWHHRGLQHSDSRPVCERRTAFR
jgi:maltose O-acetyltransferase